MENTLNNKIADRSFRLRLRLLVSIESTNISGDYFIENMSSGGLFIETRFPLKAGEECTISFTLPHNRQSYSVKAKVIWSRVDKNKQQNSGMGVSFLDLSEEEEEEVLNAIIQYRELINE